MNNPARTSLGQNVSELIQSTLSEIPSVFARLIYLASLRDSDTGRYQHYGLAEVSDEVKTHQALLEYHYRVFSQWLQLNLEQQAADLVRYASGLDTDRRALVDTWLRLHAYQYLIPSDATDTERRLYLVDLETVLKLIKARNEVDWA